MTPSEAIQKLLTAGMTEAAIGQQVGVGQSTVNKIKRGDMVPNWETGQALISLAEDIGDARHDGAANTNGGAAETDGTPISSLRDAA